MKNEPLYQQIQNKIIEQIKEGKIELITFDAPEINGISFVLQDIKLCSKDTVKLLIQQIVGEYAPIRIYIPVKLVRVEEK